MCTLFLDMVKNETSTFWKNVFEEFHHGIFPLGLYIDDGCTLRIRFSNETHAINRVDELKEFLIKNSLVTQLPESEDTIFAAEDDDDVSFETARRREARELLLLKKIIKIKNEKILSKAAYLELYHNLDITSSLRIGEKV